MKKYNLVVIIILLFFSACDRSGKVSGNDNTSVVDTVSTIAKNIIESDENKIKADTILNEPNYCINDLIDAARNNNLELARKLLEEGCDVNGTISTRPNSFISPLRYGVHHNNADMAKLLLSYGANPCQDLGREMSPFHYSAGSSPLEVFSLLAEKCKDVNLTNNNANFQTPLIWAIKEGKIDHVKILLNNGANINSDSKNSSTTPLATASNYHRFDIFKLLLENGADVNAQFAYNDEGGDCIKCPNGMTILHQLIYMNDYTDKELISQFLAELMKYNPNMNIENKSGYTPLEFACFGSDLNIVEQLISYGSKLETEGYSAIHCAAMFSNAPMVELLLKMGANPNTKTKNGTSPIMVSYECCGDGFGEGITDANRLKTTRLLLNYGADPAPLMQQCKLAYTRNLCDSIKFEY